jgi:RNA polymerase sigma-70 factor, ECF subfamily
VWLGHYVGSVEKAGLTNAADIEVLYRDEGVKLWWAILAYSGDKEIASDATAEAFARALTSPEMIRNPRAWVWRVGFRVATKELRAAGALSAPPEGIYELDEEAAEVTESLSRLSERQRAVIVLHYYADLPTDEIAELLGMNRSTVSVHLHRGRNKLREVLGEGDE